MVQALTAMLPVIAAIASVVGVMSYGVTKMYGVGALYPAHLSVRKSAQSRAGSVTQYLGVGGAAGLGYLVLTGGLFEMLPFIAATALAVGGLVWFAGEAYAGRFLGLGQKRETALRPIGRRFGAVGLSAGLFLAGYTLAALAPVAGLVGYTAYAAYKSD